MVLAPVVLALLGVVGYPWAVRASEGDRSSAALAPGFGLAAIGLTAIAVDGVGIRLESFPAGLLSVLVPLAAGVVALLNSRRAAS